MFEPIAIVGRACVLPGAHSPEQLWDNVQAGRSAVQSAQPGRWGLPHDAVRGSVGDAADRTWSDKGGYVTDFVFDADGYGIPAAQLQQLDPLFQWVLHVGRQALPATRGRTGAVFGNLSFPSVAMADYASRVWLGEQADTAGLPHVHPQNRFTSSGPTDVLAAALGLDGGGFCLDAACASSLYAIKLACDRLHDRTADVMLAGAVNRADDLFIHIGFCALSAMSKTGQSRPFHRDADGLIPAEGAAAVALKRLADAERDGDRIYGVIRGVGLSNDGRARGFLAPSAAGQVRAMQAAYQQAGWQPSDVTLVECHATGTPVGDATEIGSMAEVFAGAANVPIGSLKSNLGHLITVAGTAGLLKVLGAMEHGVRPPTVNADVPTEALTGTPFRLVTAPEAWEGPRRAAVSAFGFGGNNAHLLVEAYRPGQPAQPAPAAQGGAIAVVAMGARVAGASSAAAFAQAVRSGSSLLSQRADGSFAGVSAPLTVPLMGLKFPPKDLEQTLPQQVAVLLAGMEAAAAAPELPRDTTGVYVGMECDPEIARWGARWRLPAWSSDWASAADSFAPSLLASGVLGTMPNIPANRLNSQLDLAGPSFTASAGPHSGGIALHLACRALRAGELDAALVGAVDFSCEPVHESAKAALGDPRPAGDAAVVLVLERLEDARRAGHDVLAVLADAPPAGVAPMPPTHDQFGHSFAAGDLVDVAAAVVRVRDGHAPLETAGVWLTAPPSPSSSDFPALPLDGPTLDKPAHWPQPSIPEKTMVQPNTQVMQPAPPLPPTSDDRPGQVPPLGSGPERQQAGVPVAPPLAGSLQRDSGPPLAARASRLPVAPLGSGPERQQAGVPVAAPSTPLGSGPERQQAGVPVAPPLAGSLQRDSGPPLAARPSALPVTPLGSGPERQQAGVPVAPPLAGSLQRDSGPPLAARASRLPGQGLDPVMANLAAYHAQLSAVHQAHIAQQTILHEQFLALRNQANNLLIQQARGIAPSQPHPAPTPAPAHTGYTAAPQPAPARPTPAPAAPKPAAPKPVAKATPVAQPAVAKPPVAQAPAPVAQTPAAKTTPTRSTKAAKPGPKWDRDGLLIHSSGKISELYGPMFEQQDQYAIQVRMPEPPLLLADRVTGLDAEPGSMSRRGIIWTETDVTEDKWYLHDGFMPGGIMIESGQADLMLISWLGIDFTNKGTRKYRLLGCDLTYHSAKSTPTNHVLPCPGETLEYEIHCDGHAKHDEIRLFFFHYDCTIGDDVRLSVRNGQAGFFTTEELDESGGILWDPCDPEEQVTEGRLDPPAVPCTHSAFSRAQIDAWADGNALDCFGPGWELTQAHVRTPRIQHGKMTFLHEITDFDPAGGPWKRGYLRATADITPDDWFFVGHFKNDPCMPGTLMFEGCLQAMAFYLTSMGFTVDRDGWRFEPLPEVTVPLRCRGQVTPTSKFIEYEVFVREVHDGPVPTLVADLLCTVDGLKAFWAKNMGLRLVPAWPLDEKSTGWIAPEIPGTEVTFPAPKQVASWEGFPFDYKSLLACAWGRPSTAFGPNYSRFDGHRKVARLPGPPYHFMTHVTQIDGPMAKMKSGIEIEVEYEIPPEAWYFGQNQHPTMPFCVLMEAALQPCGWLASYVGSTLSTDDDLMFRNLDGTGKLTAELVPTSGTLRTTAKIKSISPAGGMIIESFEVRCYIGDTQVYEMDTVFGFFPPSAFENQVGLTPDDEAMARHQAPANFDVDLTARPAKYCAGSLRLAEPMLLMIDRVDGWWPTDNGARLRARKDVDKSEWFFKCHFFQDPVQPGSLGVEAMYQLLQFYMLHEGMGDGIEGARFEPIAIDVPVTWKYRGQVVPKNALISCELEVTETGIDDDGRPYAIGEAWLWVDGLRIYNAKNVGMRIVGGGTPRAADDEEVIAENGWVGDHRPTWTVPALPAMSMIDRMAAAAGTDALTDVKIHRWVTAPARIQTEVDGDEVRVLVWRDAANPKLSRFEAAATATIARDATERPHPLPRLDGPVISDPYAAGALFHGPAFHLMRDLVQTDDGASAVLDAASHGVPLGHWNQGLLDAATHPIPHDALHTWSSDIADDVAAYPFRIPEIRVFGPKPTRGDVRVEARFDGFDGDDRFPRTKVQLLVNDEVWCAFTLVEILMPKGPIGTAPAADRVAFLRDRIHVPGLTLSRTAAAETRLNAAEVKASNWLPGTIEALYGSHDEAVVAAKEHVAARAHAHPSTVDLRDGIGVSAAMPITAFPITVERDGADAVVRDAGEPRTDLTEVAASWDEWFQLGRWPVEDLYYGLIERFVRRVHFTHPEAYAAVKGRPHLYLANHQVMIESLLFSILSGAFNDLPTVTVAKMEHKETWLGQLIAHCFAYPGCRDPKTITFFDRTDRRSLFGLIDEMKQDMAAGVRSVMVHVEGTRALTSRHPTAKLGSAFIDMALKTGSPLVPVRFVGGLPVEPLDERIPFPVGGGQQDIWFGEPLLPEELGALPLRERKALVLDRINNLGVAVEDEVPLPGDAEFENAARDWAAKSGCSFEHAMVRETLVRRDVSAPVQRMLAGQFDDDWLAELGRRLGVQEG